MIYLVDSTIQLQPGREVRLFTINQALSSQIHGMQGSDAGSKQLKSRKLRFTMN